MPPDLIVKNTAPDPPPQKTDLALAPKSKTKLLTEVPEESVWPANFRDTKKIVLQ